MDRHERLWLLLMRLSNGDVVITNAHERAIINSLITQNMVRQYQAGAKLVYRLTDAGREYLRTLERGRRV